MLEHFHYIIFTMRECMMFKWLGKSILSRRTLNKILNTSISITFNTW